MHNKTNKGPATFWMKERTESKVIMIWFLNFCLCKYIYDHTNTRSLESISFELMAGPYYELIGRMKSGLKMTR